MNTPCTPTMRPEASSSPSTKKFRRSPSPQNVCEDVIFSSDALTEDSSNQPITDTVIAESVKEISHGVQQSRSSPQKMTSLNFLNEVKIVFENIFKGLNCFYKRPPASVQMIQQYLSHRRQFVTLPNSQQDRLLRLENMHRLASCLQSRVDDQLNALECSEAQSTSTSGECSHQQRSHTSVAESSLRQSLMGSNLKYRLLYLDFVEDLRMLMQLVEFILREYINESGIDFEKIHDYTLCFEIMKEDYNAKVKRFRNIEKAAKSNADRSSYEMLILHTQYIIKVIDEYITKVEYGIFILKIHEKLCKEVQHTTASIRQMMQMIYEFRAKEQ